MSMLDVFQTSDFPTAVTLLTLRHTPQFVNRENPKRAVFVYQRTPEFEIDLNEIKSGIKVDPFDFWNAQKRLKQLLYEGTEGVWR